MPVCTSHALRHYVSERTYREDKTQVLYSHSRAAPKDYDKQWGKYSCFVSLTTFLTGTRTGT